MKETYMGVEIDLSRDQLQSDLGMELLTSFYLKQGETSPQHAFARASSAFASNPEHAQRLYEAASKQWFGFASPVLSNAPLPGETSKAMPISCFLSYVADTIDGQIEASAELAALSISGGGVGQHFRMRGITDKSPGAIPYLKTSDSNICYYHQGKTRRGSVAAYLDISHPDIVEFINVRVPTGGDPNRKCLNIHNAVNITDEFLTAYDNDDAWELKCPHSDKVVHTVQARELFHNILETRFRTGEPYIHYKSESNRRLPKSLRDHGLVVHGSNLCSEITLPTTEHLTAVCCLSSLNLEHFDSWKNTTLVQDLIEMLDNVLDFFIENAPKALAKAVDSARYSRDLGLGYMGFHSYLQSKMIPFESGGFNSASQHSHLTAKNVHEEAIKATERLAFERGEPLFMKGTKRRNAHLIAVAPTANNSIIAGCSPSVEPWSANIFTHRTRAGSHVVRNKHLDKIIKDRFGEERADDIWSEILLRQGSIQELGDWFSVEEMDVFKTAKEINQKWVVELARIRQPFICQAQSINLFFPAGADRKYVKDVHLAAFSREGSGVPLKSLYYLRTTKAKKIESLGKAVVRDALKDYATQETEECLSCHG